MKRLIQKRWREGSSGKKEMLKKQQHSRVWKPREGTIERIESKGKGEDKESMHWNRRGERGKEKCKRWFKLLSSLCLSPPTMFSLRYSIPLFAFFLSFISSSHSLILFALYFSFPHPSLYFYVYESSPHPASSVSTPLLYPPLQCIIISHLLSFYTLSFFRSPSLFISALPLPLQ